VSQLEKIANPKKEYTLFYILSVRLFFINCFKVVEHIFDDYDEYLVFWVGKNSPKLSYAALMVQHI